MKKDRNVEKRADDDDIRQNRRPSGGEESTLRIEERSEKCGDAVEEDLQQENSRESGSDGAE